MITLRHWLSVATALGVAAGFALVLCALALTDIAHGEADVQQEWWAVRIGFLLIALFIATALVTLAKMRRLVRVGPLDITRGEVAV